MEKPGRIKGKNPALKKARDDNRRTARPHRIAESAARKIKAHANKTVRRAGKVAVRDADGVEEAAGTTPRLAKRAKIKAWPSDNAHAARERRDRERAFLDATAKLGPKGRRRAVERREEWDVDP